MHGRLFQRRDTDEKKNTRDIRVFYTIPLYSFVPSDIVISTTRCGRFVLLHRAELAKVPNNAIRRPTLPVSGCICSGFFRVPTTMAAIATAAATAAAKSISKLKVVVVMTPLASTPSPPTPLALLTPLLLPELSPP